MKAVVMAGGEGSRLRPLTIGRPKPMVPVANKPIIAHILDLLRRHGITEVVVTLQYMAETIQDFLGMGQHWDMNIHYSVEEVPLGTAGSVKNAQQYLDETFIIISGDALTDFDLGPSSIIIGRSARSPPSPCTMSPIPWSTAWSSPMRKDISASSWKSRAGVR